MIDDREWNGIKREMGEVSLVILWQMVLIIHLGFFLYLFSFAVVWWLRIRISPACLVA